MLRRRGPAMALAAAVLAGAALVTAGAGAHSKNLGRFASLTFGTQGGRGALEASGVADRAEAGTAAGQAGVELPAAPETPLTFTRYQTPNGWLLRPVGRQIDVARAPTGVTVSPEHQKVAVISSGIFTEDLTVVDAASFQTTPYPIGDGYMGAAIDAAGNLYASTGSRNRVYQYRLAGTVPLGERHSTPAVPQGRIGNGIPVTGYPGNMVLDAAAGKLYVAGNLSVPASVAGSACPDASPICSVVNVIDVPVSPAGDPTVAKIPVGRDAFGLALNKPAGKLYVTNWADETYPARTTGLRSTSTGTVSVLDLATGAEIAHHAVGHHPTGIALSPEGSRLYVANSADDTISRFAVDQVTGALTPVAPALDVRTTTDAPRGATPIALAFSSGGTYLLVGLAGQNAVQVWNADGTPILRNLVVNSQALTNVPTYVPTGWYPSALASAPHPSGSGTRLYVANLKGVGAGPGYNGQAEPFSGVRTQGTLSVIDFDTTQFDAWTRTVVENNNWAGVFSASADAAKDPCLDPGGGIAASQFLCDQSKATGASPYHVVYVVKENKTFDQYFGDLNARVLDADADPTFLLYGETVTTNQHRLAQQFTIGDHFWADSEASTTGHQWTSAGYATEYVEITWNPEYSEGFRGSRGSGIYDGQYVASQSLTFGLSKDSRIAAQEGELFDPEERLVDLLADSATNPRGATFRIYSDDVEEGSAAETCCRVPLELWGLKSSPYNRGRDLDFPDTDRARMFIHGKTISHSWSLDGGGPPPGFQKEAGMCGAPNPDPSDDAPQSFCQTRGSESSQYTPEDEEYEKYSLAAWTANYDECIAPPGATDAQCQNAMPNFIYMAMPVDHTLGFNPLSPTPASMVADNDFAFGLLVEALSQSPFWKNTLILTTEDDTQLAGDHVDSHRTFLLAAGGLARRHGQSGAASHQPASFPSIIKTVEVLFGIDESISIYDRAAVPLHDFVVNGLADRNSVQYQAVRPAVPFLRNPSEGDLARLSLMLDWRLDQTDPDLLTALFYYGEKGWPLPERYARLLRR